MKNKILILSLLVGLVFTAKTASAHNICLDLSGNMKVGMSDKSSLSNISSLQDFLIDKGYLVGSPVTGYFGQLTHKAVKNFQKDNNLPQTGFVGAMTRTVIKNITCVPLKNDTNTSALNTQKAQEEVVKPVTPTTPSLNLPLNTESFTDWKGTWGNVSVNESGKLRIKATTTTTGAEAILPLSFSWTNYRLKASINVLNGDVTLIARYKDANNFLGCTFSGNQISIVERLKGETKQVASTVLADMSPSNFFNMNISVSMKVDGKKVGCTSLGSDNNVSFSNVDDSLLSGGIGVSTWLPTVNTAFVELQSVKVENL